MAKGDRTGGAKIQLSLTLSLDDLITIQQVVQRDGTSLSKVCQQLVADGLQRLRTSGDREGKS